MCISACVTIVSQSNYFRTLQITEISFYIFFRKFCVFFGQKCELVFTISSILHSSSAFFSGKNQFILIDS